MHNRQRSSLYHRGLIWILGGLSICTVGTATRAGDESPADLDDLQGRFEQAYQEENYSTALELAKKISELLEFKRTAALYNVAALHCRLGHKDEAYAWLEKTLDAGFGNLQHLLTDEDFAAIRKEDKFRAMVKSTWVKQYLAMLEREDRREFQKPEQVMAALAFKTGERVADVGAGSGYFTIPVAKAVGPTGVVWAIDIKQDMLDYIEKRLKTEELSNVRLELVPPDDPQLPAGGVDTILMVDTLHYINQRTAYAEKLRAGLAPGGRVVIIDYKPKPFEERPWGPPPEQQISRETVDADFSKAGLKPVKVHDFLPEQYFVEYRAE